MVRVVNAAPEMRSSFEKQEAGNFRKKYEQQLRTSYKASHPDVVLQFPSSSKSKGKGTTSRADVVDKALEITSSNRRRSKSPTAGRRRSRSPKARRSKKKSSHNQKTQDDGGNASERSDRTAITVPLSFSPEPSPLTLGKNNNNKSVSAAAPAPAPRRKSAWELREELKRTGAPAGKKPLTRMVVKGPNNTGDMDSSSHRPGGRNPSMDSSGHSIKRRYRPSATGSELNASGHGRNPGMDSSGHNIKHSVRPSATGSELNVSGHGRNPEMDSSGHSIRRRFRPSTGSEPNLSGHGRTASRGGDRSMDTSGHGRRRTSTAKKDELNVSGHRSSASRQQDKSMDTSGHGLRRRVKASEGVSLAQKYASELNGSEHRRSLTNDKSMDTSGHGRRRMKSGTLQSKTEGNPKASLSASKNLKRANSMERRSRRRADKEGSTSGPKSTATYKTEEKSVDASGHGRRRMSKKKKDKDSDAKDRHDESSKDKLVPNAKERYRRMLKKQDNIPEEDKSTPTSPKESTIKSKKEGKDLIDKVIEEDAEEEAATKKSQGKDKVESKASSRDGLSKSHPSTVCDEPKKEADNPVDAAGYVNHLRTKRESRNSPPLSEKRKSKLRESLTNKPENSLPPAFAAINATVKEIRPKRSPTRSSTLSVSATSSPGTPPKTPSRTPAWKLREQQKHVGRHSLGSRTPVKADLPPAFQSPRTRTRTRRDGSTYIVGKQEKARQERASQGRRGSILSSMSKYLDEEEDETGKKKMSKEGKVEVNAEGKARIVFELGDVPDELLKAGNGARIPIGSIPIGVRN